MVEDLGHLGPQHADGAVVGGEDVRQERHVSADGRPPLYQVNMQTRVRQIQCGCDPGHASSYYQYVFADRYALGLQRPQECGFGHCHCYQVFGLLCGHSRLVHVHPGALFPDIGHLQHVRVQPGLGYSPAKCGLMQTRRAGCYDYPIELELCNILLDLLLSGIGTGELQISGDCHIGQLFREAFQLLHVQDTGDVQAAVTDVNTNRHETPDSMIALNHLNLCNFDCYNKVPSHSRILTILL